MAHAHWQVLRPGRAQTFLDPLLPAYDSTGDLCRRQSHGMGPPILASAVLEAENLLVSSLYFLHSTALHYTDYAGMADQAGVDALLRLVCRYCVDTRATLHHAGRCAGLKLA